MLYLNGNELNDCMILSLSPTQAQYHLLRQPNSIPAKRPVRHMDLQQKAKGGHMLTGQKDQETFGAGTGEA